ncbi:hypothetical protein ACUH9X_08235 [Dermabacteraceae bacterium P13147]
MFNNILPSDIKNPFDGISPDINVFGTGFSSLTNTLLSGAWAAALIGCAIYIAISGYKWAAARKQAHTDNLMDAAGALKISLLAFAATAASPILVQAILALIAAARK